MRADSLNEKIAHRPKPEELIQEGILERKGNKLGRLLRSTVLLIKICYTAEGDPRKV
jgi:hypothetical protein